MGFNNWKINPNILGIFSATESKFCFPGNQAWRPRNEAFQIFQILKKVGFNHDIYFYKNKIILGDMEVSVE